MKPIGEKAFGWISAAQDDQHEDERDRQRRVDGRPVLPGPRAHTPSAPGNAPWQETSEPDFQHTTKLQGRQECVCRRCGLLPNTVNGLRPRAIVASFALGENGSDALDGCSITEPDTCSCGIFVHRLPAFLSSPARARRRYSDDAFSADCIDKAPVGADGQNRSAGAYLGDSSLVNDLAGRQRASDGAEA
jgi:hypothetical protein